jgi:hypothetical protein
MVFYLERDEEKKECLYFFRDPRMKCFFEEAIAKEVIPAMLNIGVKLGVVKPGEGISKEYVQVLRNGPHRQYNNIKIILTSRANTLRNVKVPLEELQDLAGAVKMGILTNIGVCKNWYMPEICIRRVKIANDEDLENRFAEYRRKIISETVENSEYKKYPPIIITAKGASEYLGNEISEELLRELFFATTYELKFYCGNAHYSYVPYKNENGIYLEPLNQI